MIRRSDKRDGQGGYPQVKQGLAQINDKSVSQLTDYWARNVPVQQTEVVSRRLGLPVTAYSEKFTLSK
jgi:hypothetical protein